MGGKGVRCIELTILSFSRMDCLEILELQPNGTLWFCKRPAQRLLYLYQIYIQVITTYGAATCNHVITIYTVVRYTHVIIICPIVSYTHVIMICTVISYTTVFIICPVVSYTHVIIICNCALYVYTVNTPQ